MLMKLTYRQIFIFAAFIFSGPATAQIIQTQVPVNDTNCSHPYPAFGTDIVQSVPSVNLCTTSGTRSVGPPTITQTASGPDNTTVRADWRVGFSGNLGIDGFPVALGSFFPNLTDATSFYSSVSVSANVTSSYTGIVQTTVSNALAPAISSQLATFVPGAFTNYSVLSTTLNALSVNVQNRDVIDQTTGRKYAYSVSTPSSTVVNGNSVGLVGRYQTNDANGAIIFGALRGNATLT